MRWGFTRLSLLGASASCDGEGGSFIASFVGGPTAWNVSFFFLFYYSATYGSARAFR